jgi:hypothetical protein
MKTIALVVTVAMLAGCSSSAKDSASQAAATASADAAGSAAGASASLEGVKGRIPVYDSNIPSKPQAVMTGMYGFETSDPPAQVAAWYKAHVPAGLGGKWSDPDPDAVPEWVYQAKLSDGAVNVTIQPANPANQSSYAAGTKSIVAVIDR